MNFENLIYQNGNLVRYGILFTGIIIIFFSIKNSIELYVKYAELNRAIRTLEAAPAATQLSYSLEAFDKIDLNETIFEAISEASKTNEVVVKSISTPVIVEKDDHL